ncbi:MAG: WYL domain-containing protein [Firmicutes bacterium]|nr:WYL domain-containing protein [Bacillota bacterium]
MKRFLTFLLILSVLLSSLLLTGCHGTMDPEAVVLNDTFECRNVPVPELSSDSKAPHNIVLKALFDADMKWRLVEEFGPDCYKVAEDGRLILSEAYYDLDNLVMWLLTFGDKVEVLEPPEVRDKLRAIAESISSLYK